MCFQFIHHNYTTLLQQLICIEKSKQILHEETGASTIRHSGTQGSDSDAAVSPHSFLLNHILSLIMSTLVTRPIHI